MRLLSVSELTVRLSAGIVLRDVSLSIEPGEALGLVGESGSGKSMTARAIGRLLPRGAVISAGRVEFGGKDVAGMSAPELRGFRSDVAMIFQDPRAHINPVRRIGDFMTEALRAGGVASAQAVRRAVAMLGEVGITEPERRLRQYPHELSGGMLQRVMIAAALLTEPRLLLADEPTTALDVTTQSDVMALLAELRESRGLALLFITHDLELAAAICDRTAVMYAGQIVEVRSSELLHDDPLHPYTAALSAARPDIAVTRSRLRAIPGRPLSAFEAPASACAFLPRCSFAVDGCSTATPELVGLDGGLTRCLRAAELHGTMEAADA